MEVIKADIMLLKIGKYAWITCFEWWVSKKMKYIFGFISTLY